MATRNPFFAGSEQDLRKELSDMFFGHGRELPKSNRVLLRRIRRGTNGYPIPCSCKDTMTGEADVDHFCPFCHGEGYYWDEEWVNVRSVEIGSTLSRLSFIQNHLPAGIQATKTKVFWLEYYIKPTHYDKIIELYYDDEGSIVMPAKRQYIYRPQSVIPFRSDFGRIEFYAYFGSQSNAIQTEQSYMK